ncbi:major capsid protein [Dipodfec virus UOA04_Rod_1209]|nr:major capsid protein [Dipodfec virus UOA04_Rod_1209]
MSVFDTIKVRKPKKSNFDLSHEVKLSTEFGRLTPILFQDVLPGDTWSVNTEIFTRMAPMLAPIMHRVDVYTHFFYVPKRLLWSKWNDFIFGGENGEDKPLYPRFEIGDINLSFPTNVARNLFGPSSLMDYLGFPVPNNPDISMVSEIDALPFKAYQLIYNEYYRDQNLEDPIDIGVDQEGVVRLPQPMTAGGENASINMLYYRNRAWKKDYFTSALPWAQRGAQVTIPLLGDAPIYTDPSLVGQTRAGMYKADGGKLGPGTLQVANGSGTTGTSLLINKTGDTTFQQVNYDLGTKGNKKNPHRADLSEASGISINDFRRLNSVQRFLEAMARGGSRAKEALFNIFGVNSSDARLQRPEYLGGGVSPITISEVLQHSQTTEGNNGSPLGDMGGHGASVGRTHSFKRYFEEHGYVIGIMSIIPKASYQQGMPRMFRKFDQLDHAFPQFAHLGEQEIKNGELYWYWDDADSVNDDNVFGYAPRYSEYKYIPNSVHGDMRDTLAYWHLGRIFNQQPGLNKDFVTVGWSPDESERSGGLNRIFAAEKVNYDHFWIQIYHNIRAKRPLPYYGTPSL